MPVRTNEISPALQRIWESTHRTKVHYASKREAQHYLRGIKKRHGAPLLEVYPCKICGKYVLGTRKPKNKDKVA